MTTRLALVLTAGFAWCSSGTVAYGQTDLPVEVKMLIEAGEPGDAIALLKKRIETSPNHAGLHVQLAEVYCAKFPSDWPSAKSSARRALVLDPTNGPAHQILGAIAVQEGDFATGIRESSVALRQSLSPQYRVEANRRLGNAYEAQGDFVSAARAYEAALAVARTPGLNRPDEILYLWIGQALIRAGRYEEAIGPLEQSIKFLTPKPTAARVALGLSVVALEKAGRLEDARKRQEAWEQAEPDATARNITLKRVGASPKSVPSQSPPTNAASYQQSAERANTSAPGGKEPPLELPGTIWFCTVGTVSGGENDGFGEIDGFLAFQRSGHVKVIESARRGLEDNDRVFAEIWMFVRDWNSPDEWTQAARDVNSIDHVDHRWTSTTHEARFIARPGSSLYVLRRKGDQLVGNWGGPVDAEGSPYLRADAQLTAFNVPLPNNLPNPITCSRARGWLQR